ncbi:MAG: glycosyltransferase family 2 protein [Proteobacteria bacterium]|nr:glycosyltransferase family 2 protein [Pseudomonadota bacterium]
MTISICIICFNEEKNIRRCLECATWANEIIVVDSMSQDKTVEIAREYTDKVYQEAWPGYVDQKNCAISKANGNWILSMDADEEITAALRDEILAETGKADAKNGYRIPRRSFYQGRWINHSGYYPDRQLRLFRRERGHWTGGRVHERVDVQGSTGDLKKDLLHYPYKGVISGQLQTVNSFSSLMAEDMYERGKHYHISLLLLRPTFKFFEVYLLKLGFLDGLAGFIIAVTSAYAMFVRYIKLRELWNRLGNQPST